MLIGNQLAASRTGFHLGSATTDTVFPLKVYEGDNAVENVTIFRHGFGRFFQASENDPLTLTYSKPPNSTFGAIPNKEPTSWWSDTEGDASP